MQLANDKRNSKTNLRSVLILPSQYGQTIAIMAILESKLKNGKNNDQKNSENNYACKTFNIHV